MTTNDGGPAVSGELNHLPQKWREEAGHAIEKARDKNWTDWVREGYAGEARQLIRCANELEAALQSLTIRQSAALTDEAVKRFLGWRLPQDFAPDCGVSFTPLGHPNGWPIGTNLLTAAQARALFEYCLTPAGAPTAQKPLDDAANNAGVAAGSRNASPSESVTRGSLPALTSRQSAGAGEAVAELQRWSVIADHTGGVEEFKNVSGRWVRYSDVKSLLSHPHAAPAGVSEWLPIESAPNCDISPDEEWPRFLAVTQKGDVDMIDRRLGAYFAQCVSNAARDEEPCWYTHWRSLPEPPALQEPRKP